MVSCCVWRVVCADSVSPFLSSPTRPAYCATDVVKRRQRKKGRLRHFGVALQEDRASFFQNMRTPGKSWSRTGPLPFFPTEAHRGTVSPLPQTDSGRVGSRTTLPHWGKMFLPLAPYPCTKGGGVTSAYRFAMNKSGPGRIAKRECEPP